MQETIFNSTIPYNQVYGIGSCTSDGKSKLLEKLNYWKKGTILAKGKGKNVLPTYFEKELANIISTLG